jgi:hypothetical protein
MTLYRFDGIIGGTPLRTSVWLSMACVVDGRKSFPPGDILLQCDHSFVKTFQIKEPPISSIH